MSDRRFRRSWYPPLSIGLLAVICLMKAYLQIKIAFVVNTILQEVPGEGQAPMIVWQPAVLVAALLVTAIGLWFERGWARWIARVWASFDVLLALLFSFGLLGVGQPNFNINRWGAPLGFFCCAWLSKFRREHASPPSDDEWEDDELLDPVTINFKLGPAYEGGAALWSSYQLHSESGIKTIVDRHITESPVKIGSLPLPTGRIVAMDPGNGPDYDREFDEAVTPGRYPVYLTLARHATNRDQFVAYAVIRFNETVPTHWRPASLTPIAEPEIPVDAIPSMYTDSAMGCFIDAGVLTRLRESGEPFPKIDELDAMLTEEHPGAVVKLSPDDPDAIMVIFQTGTGDGVYNSYWGLDEAGKTCALATDFDLSHASEENPLLTFHRAERKYAASA